MGHINVALHEVVPKIATVTTNWLMKDNISRIVVEAMKNDPQSQVVDYVIWEGLKGKFDKTTAPPNTCKPEASRQHDHDDNPYDNPEGEKSSKRQKTTEVSSSAIVTTSSNPTSSSKPTTVRKSKIHALQPPILAYDSTIQEIDDDENVFEEATIEFLTEIQGKKWVPTTTDFHKMKFAYNDIMKSQCKNGTEYEYHLQ
nr:hypothetical protein [Tanacetum cinerariifolium]